jgi:ribosomal-protein-alanine N-acetyltransferase
VIPLSDSFACKDVSAVQLATAQHLDAIFHLQLMSGYNSWSKRHIAQLIAEKTVLVCVNTNNDEAMACLFFSVVFEQAELLNIAVHSQCKRHGLAMLLIHELKHRLHGQSVTSVFLEVAENNYPALALYKKNRFKQVGVRKAYYLKDNERFDAHILRMNIN